MKYAIKSLKTGKYYTVKKDEFTTIWAKDIWRAVLFDDKEYALMTIDAILGGNHPKAPFGVKPYIEQNHGRKNIQGNKKN